ncbi:MAG: type IVB secretion system protein IcmH/DotU [Gammaproteobacteria bacterium]
MAPIDPFGNDDKTVLRPSPGGRMPQSPFANRPAAAPPPPISNFRDNDLALLGKLSTASCNSLLDLSSAILSLAARLKVSVSYSAIDDLKQKLAKQISEFESKAIGAGNSQEHVRIASYALCSYLDETIQNTPWGSQSNWGHQSLLILFHKEAWGGERFFQLLEQMVKQPSQNLYLLEFCYVLLSFGFEGKYRLMNGGINELERHRLELYQLIQRVQGDFPVELSPRWQGQHTGKTTLMSQVPLWVFATVAAGLLLLCYLGFAFYINAASDPVYRELVRLGKDPIQLATSNYAAPAPTPSPPKEPAKPRLERFRPLLRAEIARNMVEVVDDSILRVKNSFASGSDQVKPEFMPMLRKIAQELEQEQDSILVTGHTDNIPIVSARFPSNWHLSAARAKNVLAILEESARLSGSARAEGRGDAEPLVDNDTKEHRAINRRVDIFVK